MNRLTAIQSEAALATAIEAALTERGWIVKVIRRHITFTRLLATIRDETIEIDLAVDSPLLFPIEHLDGRPTLAPQDLAARKILAILDRAEGHDFTDLWGWRSGSAAQSA